MECPVIVLLREKDWQWKSLASFKTLPHGTVHWSVIWDFVSTFQGGGSIRGTCLGFYSETVLHPKNVWMNVSKRRRPLPLQSPNLLNDPDTFYSLFLLVCPWKLCGVFDMWTPMCNAQPSFAAGASRSGARCPLRSLVLVAVQALYSYSQFFFLVWLVLLCALGMYIFWFWFDPLRVGPQCPGLSNDHPIIDYVEVCDLQFLAFFDVSPISPLDILRTRWKMIYSTKLGQTFGILDENRLDPLLKYACHLVHQSTHWCSQLVPVINRTHSW